MRPHSEMVHWLFAANFLLLGLIMVARLQMAAMSRVDMPEDQRKDFYLYVDEFQNFATDSFCSILSRNFSSFWIFALIIRIIS